MISTVYLFRGVKSWGRWQLSVQKELSRRQLEDVFRSRPFGVPSRINPKRCFSRTSFSPSFLGRAFGTVLLHVPQSPCLAPACFFHMHRPYGFSGGWDFLAVAAQHTVVKITDNTGCMRPRYELRKPVQGVCLTAQMLFFLKEEEPQCCEAGRPAAKKKKRIRRGVVKKSSGSPTNFCSRRAKIRTWLLRNDSHLGWLLWSRRIRSAMYEVSQLRRKETCNERGK